MIRRIYVEKKPGFDIAAANMLDDLRTNLEIKSLSGVRILIYYDTGGLDEKQFDDCVVAVFSEPPVDMVYREEFCRNENDFIFAVKFLPGQYDQRADSAEQCVRAVTGVESVVIETGVVYVCQGNLTEDDKNKIKKYSVNPVDSGLVSLEKPESLQMIMTEPTDVGFLDGLSEMNNSELKELYSRLELAMSEADFLFCADYFKNTEKRNPTISEIRVIDTYWSDHCRHTTFSTELTDIEIEDGKYKPVFEEALNIYLDEHNDMYKEKPRAITLMDIATLGMKSLKKKGFLQDLDESEEINACSINVDVDNSITGETEKWLVMFKNETHNHPTEIEPFGGAATCLGGAIRDPLSGRSYVYQAMRVTGSANPNAPVSSTIPGKLPQRKLTTEAARGYSSYGNQIGLATGQVTEIYDDGYMAKRLEIGAVVGAVKKENVRRERPIKGDIIILVGGRTGRDGIGGATGSSKGHDEKSALKCGAEVQKGNPPTERKLQRLFANPEATALIKRCNDFGAGGVSVAIGELAEGLVINLDSVPKKYDGLDGTELAISESQERMAVVVSSDDVDKFISLSEKENLEATTVASVTDDRRLKMLWRGSEIVDISRDFLDTNGAKQTATAKIMQPNFADTADKKPCDDISIVVNSILSNLNIASQKGLVERFDASIGAGSVFMPYGGKNQLTPAEVMAAKIPVPRGETNTATLMSFGFNPEISKQSPFHGAVSAVIESISKIVANGGDYSKVRLTFQEYFERLGDDPAKWGKPLAALLGAFYAQTKLNIPSIGGKDSMSGTYKDMDVPPTLVSFAITTADARELASPEFKSSGNTIAAIYTRYDENNLPDFDSLTKTFTTLNKLIKNKTVVSAHTYPIGGVIAALCKMALGNGIGFDVRIETPYDDSPKYGSFIVEISQNAVDSASTLENLGVDFEILGTTTDKPTAVFNKTEITLSDVEKTWLSPLESVFPTELLKKADETNCEIKPFISVKTLKSKNATASPRVFIPVFPGTNSEIDTAHAFQRAKAETDVFVLRNLNVNQLNESLKEMAERINNSQMIVLSGGFSAGDEPDGSGKFITAVFKNPYVREATMNLLKKRDGLILGICNGFQALIKLGLVPFGEIEDMDENSPTLTFNSIGRHVSVLARTKIVSNVSPWLYNTEIDDTHIIPVSHGEGRLVADMKLLEELARNGQIATQYVDEKGNATMDIRHNPNGSMLAVEGLISPDGRVFGKMGHSERSVGGNVFINVPGNKDQQIFEAGVNYFK